MARKIKSELVSVESRYGWMEFESMAKALEFRRIICTWAGFTADTAPSTVAEAVEYHMAYCAGGVAEVYAAMRHREQMAAIRSAEREARYHAARLAPRDSIFYKEHYCQDYPGYRWGR